MKTEIILLIIAFQVVAGIMAKRKARKAAEAARNPSSASVPDRNAAQAPAPSHPKPAQPSATRPTRPTSQQTALSRRAEAGKAAAKAPPPKPFIPEGYGTEAPRSIGSTSVTQEPEAETASSLARQSLMDPESVRRAYILKTIFDKPLALQPRRPGEV